MITCAAFRMATILTLTFALMLPSRALSNDTDGCSADGSGSSGSVTSAAEGAKGTVPPPSAPPMAPGGGTGGTIGSLPTLVKNIASLLPGLPPSFFNYGTTNYTFSGPLTVVAAPPKSFVAAYGWVVNGTPIFGGALNQLGPVLAFPTLDIKAAVLTTSSLYLVFYGQDGSPIAAVDAKKLL